MYRMASVEVENGPRIQCVIPEGLAIRMTDECVIESGGVLEYGTVADLRDVEGKQPDMRNFGRIVRRATLQDQSRAKENALMGGMAGDTILGRADKYGLKLDIVHIRYSFEKTVLTVLYRSDTHIDCRELVKELAGEFGARVDMREIGVRDQAGIVGGMGSCGRKLCCCTWLKRFEPVNVRMAKAQDLSLNPGAISGMCGRLKCCLRYEHEAYLELGRNVPHHGCRVKCPDGDGVVIDRSVLSRRVKVKLSRDRTVSYDASDVTPAGFRSGDSAPGKRQVQEKRRDEDHAFERTQSESSGNP